MTQHPHLRPAVGAGLALVAFLAATPSEAASRRLAVVLAPATANAGAIGARLAGRGFALGPALWRDPQLQVHVADATRDPSTREVYEAIEEARRAAGVLAAGELLAADPGRVQFYSGQVLVRFRDALDEAAARRWGAPLGLTLVEPVAGALRSFLFDAPLEPSRLLALAGALPVGGVIEELLPILHEITEDPPMLLRRSVYHRIPPGRNLLAVLLVKGASLTAYEATIQLNGGVVIAGDGTPQQVVRFPDEPHMMQAIAAIIGLPEVRRTGPAISTDPLAFLTDQLVVRFTDDDARYVAKPRLDAHLLEEVRRLSWAQRTYLYRVPLPSYEIYDAARELILHRDAIAAVPNLVTLSTSACGDDSCVTGGHQDYLRQIDVCDVWSLPATNPVVLAVLDEGIQAHEIKEPETRLSVGTAIDLEAMKACQPGVPSSWWTDPACTAVFPGWAAWTADHGNKVALLAAADHDNTDLRGVAPSVTLINAMRPTHQSDVAFAEALWWLAGGDPKWCRDGSNYDCTLATGSPAGSQCGSPPATCTEDPLPQRLLAPHRADVINLSFPREDFLVENCPNVEICKLVCNLLGGEDPSSCGVVDEVLKQIRQPDLNDGVRTGGAVVVAAAGISAIETLAGGSTVDKNGLCYSGKSPTANTSSWNFQTDLAESPWTVAAGSVTSVGARPFERDAFGNDCVIQFSQFGSAPFLDVVAPLGGEGGTQICKACTIPQGGNKAVDFGSSSAATAAVSGVAALMLQQNPSLTADQVQCLLGTSAAKQDGPNQIWPPADVKAWGVPGCEFVSGYSPCMGHGMLNACAAVDAALACAGSTACPCVPPPVEEEPAVDVVADTCNGVADVTSAIPLFDAGIRCFWDPLCTCVLPDCVRLRTRNCLGPLRDVEFKICVGSRCWRLQRLRKWRPQAEVVLPFDVGRGPLLRSRATGEPLELRIFSRGVPVTSRNSRLRGRESP